MLKDQFGRTISCLRISITDRCNYQCAYCQSPETERIVSGTKILSFEEIARVAGAAGRLGFSKIKLTGGEPLVRRNCEFLVQELTDLRMFNDISLTTNGSILTADKAFALKLAGLHRVNISLDTLDPIRFAEITGGGILADVLDGISNAHKAGLSPVKINMVVFPETTEKEISQMRTFCAATGSKLQTIGQFFLDNRSPSGSIRSTDRPHTCSSCNRLRLTADGHLKLCLHDDREIKVDFGDLEGSLRAAVAEKPFQGTGCHARTMMQIGG